MKRKPLIDDNGEVRELTGEDFKLFKPSSEVLPHEFLKALPRRGRPCQDRHKVATTIRLDQEVMNFFKARGNGWQTRINEVLREYVKTHKIA